MNRSALGVIVAVAVSVTMGLYKSHLTTPTTTADFKKYVSPDHKFALDFPGEPALGEQTQPVVGLGTLTMHTLRVASFEVEYIAGYSEIPISSSVYASRLQTAYNNCGAGMANGVHGHITSERRVTLGKVTGREWDIEGDSSGNEDFRYQAFFVQKRQYIVGVGWLKGRKPQSELLDKFFKSFVISEM